MTPAQHQARAPALAEKLIEFLGTGEVPDGLFAAGMFCDLILPAWRLQACGVEDGVALRLAGHPGAGDGAAVAVRSGADRVRPRSGGGLGLGRRALDCRELFRAGIGDEGITQLPVYCTGDWDAARRAEHAAAVTLIRP